MFRCHNCTSVKSEMVLYCLVWWHVVVGYVCIDTLIDIDSVSNKVLKKWSMVTVCGGVRVSLQSDRKCPHPAYLLTFRLRSLWRLCTGWSINNRTILNCSHFLARWNFSIRFHLIEIYTLANYHSNKSSPMHYLLFCLDVTLCHLTMWTVQQIMFCVEAVISVKLLKY